MRTNEDAGRSSLQHTTVFSNKNRHRKQYSGKFCRQQAIVWGLSDDLHGYTFSYIAVQIKFRNTLLTTERLVAASEGRMSDIAFKVIHEQEEWATGAPVCRAFGPLRDKGHKRKILIKYKWTIKVKVCCKTTLRAGTILPPRVYRWAAFTLYRLSYILFIVLLFGAFCATKSTYKVNN